jgi:hypothetical protein
VYAVPFDEEASHVYGCGDDDGNCSNDSNVYDDKMAERYGGSMASSVGPGETLQEDTYEVADMPPPGSANGQAGIDSLPEYAVPFEHDESGGGGGDELYEECDNGGVGSAASIGGLVVPMCGNGLSAGETSTAAHSNV